MNYGFVKVAAVTPKIRVADTKYNAGVIVEGIREAAAAGAKVIAADALAIAREAGSEKAVNVALIGLMAHALGFDRETLIEAIRMSVPPKFLELNLKAFELGDRARA